MFMQRTAMFGAVLWRAGRAADFFDIRNRLLNPAISSARFKVRGNVTQELIAQGYQAAPALMLGLMLLMVVPLIASDLADRL